jgi:hypothetical protein
MRRVWEEVAEFPSYQVSNYGEFANIRTDREVQPSMNQLGHAKITLNHRGRQYTRSVALLVARAFVDSPQPHFDTPIHLDGDLMNCCAWNLMWRPRWFAIRYHKQFRLDTFHTDMGRRMDVESGIVYDSLKETCMANGLYYYDVIKSEVEGTFVFPTMQEFRPVH